MTTLITIYVICHNHSVWILSLQNYNFSSTFTYLRYLFSLKSVKTVPICTEIHQKALPLPANSLTMEQIFGINSIDIKGLREFCGREGKMVEYRKGEQLEREGDPARWFGFVTEGCFKYVTHGISDDKEHITWFSFEGEFAGDYPACLDGGPALTTIEAMVPRCRAPAQSGPCPLHRPPPRHAPRTLRVAAPPLPRHRPPSSPECHRLVPLRHSPTVVTHPQGRHV